MSAAAISQPILKAYACGSWNAVGAYTSAASARVLDILRGMSGDRLLFALLLAGGSAPVYFVIQLILGDDPVDSLIRSFWFFLVLFAVGLAFDWSKRRPSADDPKRPPADDREAP